MDKVFKEFMEYLLTQLHAPPFCLSEANTAILALAVMCREGVTLECCVCKEPSTIRETFIPPNLILLQLSFPPQLRPVVLLIRGQKSHLVWFFLSPAYIQYPKKCRPAPCSSREQETPMKL